MGGLGAQWRVFPDESRRQWALAEATAREGGVEAARWLCWDELVRLLASSMPTRPGEDTLLRSLALELALQRAGPGLMHGSGRHEDVRAAARGLLDALEDASVPPAALGDALGETLADLPPAARARGRAVARLYG